MVDIYIFQGSDDRWIAIEVGNVRRCSNKVELDMTTFGIFDMNGFIPFQFPDGQRFSMEIDIGTNPIHPNP